MKINPEGLALVQQFEGLYLSAYRDPVGVWTIGWGHTGPEAFEGNRISRPRALELLAQDLADFEAEVTQLVAVPLNPNQFSALVSFAFNVGAGALQRSSLLRLLNQGNYAGAALEFRRWNKATIDGQKVELRGLTRRRAAEANLFLTPLVPRAELADSRTIKAGRVAAGTAGVGLVIECAQALNGFSPVIERLVDRLAPLALLLLLLLIIAVIYFRTDDHRRGLR